MADDYSGWTLQKAGPDEYSGWALQPATQEAQAPKPTLGQALLRGGAQGATLGFADESAGVGGLLGSLYGKYAPEIMGGAPRAYAKEIHPLDSYKEARDEYRAADEAAKKEHGAAFTAAELAGALPTSFLAPLNAGKGAKLLQLMGKGALSGAIGGLGASNADLTQGDYLRAALDTGAGAAIGAGSGALAAGLGKLAASRLAKAQAIKDAVAAKAAQTAADETNSLRSAAGRAAQDSYKQLEHLRELGAMDKLTPEQKLVASRLEQELAGKAQDKLLSSAAHKEATAKAFAEGVANEADRAKAIEAQKLSGGEAWNQLKARALRYGLPAVGGLVAGAAGFGGHGALAGAGTGALMGAGLRPMMHSLIRMAEQPAISRPANQAAAAILGHLFVPGAARAAGASGMAGPSAADVLSKFMQPKAPDYSQWQPVEGQ